VTTVRVLVVDDSPTVRAVLGRVLGAAHGVTVVGVAEDGADAIEAALRLKPDAIVMDLDLPRVDGLTATERIMELCPTPIVVVTSKVQRDQMGIAFAAMKRGAVAVFPKPEVPDEWEELGHVLPETLRQVGSRTSVATHHRTCAPPATSHQLRFLLVGASTGGPEAVCQLLAGLGSKPALGVAVVQHISPGFEVGFADWLAAEIEADVAIARDGEELSPGRVRIAPPGTHLLVEAGGVQRLDCDRPAINGHRPAADELFRSMVDTSPHQVAAVLLSGMGSDGAEAMLALRRAGALTAAQDEASCAVFGMPRAARELGATDILLPPAEIGKLLMLTAQGVSR